MWVQVTTNNPDANNTTFYAEYEQVGGEWVMRRWRVGFDSTGYPPRRLEGKWYRIHGNRKRPMGDLPIRTRTLSDYTRGEHRTMMLIAK